MKRFLVLGDTSYSNLLTELNKFCEKSKYEVDSVYPNKINTSILKSIANKKYSLILFSGGSDVDSSIYGQEKQIFTVSDLQRDKLEQDLYLIAVEAEIPMLGICRGAQFLTVMQKGGALLQHVLGHTRDHNIEVDPEYALPDKDDNYYLVTSTHHQMMDLRNIDPDNYIIIGKTTKESRKIDAGNRVNMKEFDKMLDSNFTLHDIPFDSPEIVYYINTNCLAIQGHPEFQLHSMGRSFLKLSLYLVSNLLLKEELNVVKKKSNSYKMKLETSWIEEIPRPRARARERIGVDANQPIAGADAIDPDEELLAEREEEEQDIQIMSLLFRDPHGQRISLTIDNQFQLIIDIATERAFIDGFDVLNNFIASNLLYTIYQKVKGQLFNCSTQLISILAIRYYYDLIVMGRYQGSGIQGIADEVLMGLEFHVHDEFIDTNTRIGETNGEIAQQIFDDQAKSLALHLNVYFKIHN